MHVPIHHYILATYILDSYKHSDLFLTGIKILYKYLICALFSVNDPYTLLASKSENHSRKVYSNAFILMHWDTLHSDFLYSQPVR